MSSIRHKKIVLRLAGCRLLIPVLNFLRLQVPQFLRSGLNLTPRDIRMSTYFHAKFRKFLIVLSQYFLTIKQTENDTARSLKGMLFIKAVAVYILHDST